MSDKKEARKLRKANRKKRRLERRAERKERRAKRREGKGTLRLTIAEKVNAFLDHEFEKIQVEKQQELAANAGQVEPAQSINPQELLKKYLFKALVQGAKSGALPGFVGMVTLVPEIVGNVKNQLRMVYDLGVANGYPPNTHKDIIIYVFLDSLGKKLTGFGVIKGDQIMVSLNSNSTLQSIIKIIAGYVVSQLVRSLVCKWLPGIGSAAMMAWAHHSIMKISSNATGLFNHDIVLDEQAETSPQAIDLAVLEEQSIQDEDDDADFIKFLTLVDLMRQDGKIQPKEKGLFLEMLQNSDFEDDEKEELYNMLDSEEEIDPDLNFFKENPDDALGLIFDLVALAKVDENLHTKEVGYLFEVADEIAFPREQLMQMLEE